MMRLLIPLAVTVSLTVPGGAGVGIERRPVQPAHVGLYDANPDHLWNRIHAQFRVRVAPDGTEHGFDRLDPLLWHETRYLLTGPSHQRAIALLDEFLTSGGERLVREPLKRAVFQNDLWSIFDWLTAAPERDRDARTALMRRVARVIRRVALTRKEIEALPDTYAAAVASGAFPDRAEPSQSQVFLPRDMFSESGAWVSIGGIQPAARQHAAELGRSAFVILWSLPGGATATAAYLRTLWNFSQPFVLDKSFDFARDGEVRIDVNSAELPPVPEGTRVALVRKMLLIDDNGVIGPSNVVQSVQLRIFGQPTKFSEVVMTRANLFAAKAGGLRAVARDEKDFLTFSAKPMDPFEHDTLRGTIRMGPVLSMCATCHQVEFERGLRSVRSIRSMLSPNEFVDSRHPRWKQWFTQPIVAAEKKMRSYEWGVLQGLWHAELR